MKNKSYLFYTDYIKGKNIEKKEILISKTKNSYMIGPLINKEFDNYSFYKRLTSNSIYSLKIYKKICKNKCVELINKYQKLLMNNEVVEVLFDGKIIKHKIIPLPGDYYDKE